MGDHLSIYSGIETSFVKSGIEAVHAIDEGLYLSR